MSTVRSSLLAADHYGAQPNGDGAGGLRRPRHAGNGAKGRSAVRAAPPGPPEAGRAGHGDLSDLLPAGGPGDRGRGGVLSLQLPALPVPAD